MDKEEKVNYVKAWLQRFGERDNETFNVMITVGEIMWFISLQYDYDLEGERCDPYSWCRDGFKHLNNNGISDRSEEELDKIIDRLNNIKTFY